MNERRLVATMSYYLHAHFLWFLIGSYVLAALWPTCGLWIRDVSLGQIGIGRIETMITLPC